MAGIEFPAAAMTDFLIKRLPYNLTAQAGLSLVGQYLKRFAQIDQIIDPRFPISGQGGIATSSLLKAYVGLLCTGKSDFDAIESRCRDAFFKDALGLVAVPSSPTLRQRMDALADAGEPALTALDEANERLLRRAKPAFTPLSTGHLALDFDVFTLDSSGTAKEGVGRTYMGFDGYAPIAGYLAEEGYCLGLELRPGTQHSASETPDFLKRLLPRARAVTSLPLLVRADSGFDGAAIFVAMAEARASGALDWLTSLDLPAADIVKLYQGHGTHEQFHSEFKTDLDLERLPSGKFATNDLVLSLAVLAFNILRAIG